MRVTRIHPTCYSVSLCYGAIVRKRTTTGIRFLHSEATCGLQVQVPEEPAQEGDSANHPFSKQCQKPRSHPHIGLGLSVFRFATMFHKPGTHIIQRIVLCHCLCLQ